jgi:uncharacterized protein YbcV (DUF1398 family)
MQGSVREVVEAASRGSEEGTLNFPQVLAKLSEAGVEGYYADLRGSRNTYYLMDGRSIDVATEPSHVPVAAPFDAVTVENAVRLSQAGAHSYRQFLDMVKAAGCAGYLVSLPGRRVVYFGRTAESHVEHFPARA